VDEGVGVELFDQYGNRVPCQLSDISRYPHGGLKSARVTFIAKEVPPIGYTTYYYKPVSIAASLPVAANVEGRFENGFYIMELDSRGICYLFDRESGIEIIGGEDMRGGEVFTMQSAGNGAGEFIDIQQPGMEGYDYTGSGQESQSWKVIEEGDVFTTYMIRQKIRNATVERRIRFYHLVKKIDLDVSLLNWEGVLFREFRMGLALNMTSAKVAYDVPYGVVEVGKDEMDGSAGERYVTNCSDIHPRGIQNWIGASDNRIGVTLSSSVAVADFIDPRDNPLQGPVLQPILLASRQSCHWEGNDYLQTGDHHYHFSFTTHRPGWENGYRFGTGSNEKLFAVQGYRKYSDAKLPETMSFFSIDAENIMVSAVKKAEDSDNIVIRGYDIKGLETRARINMFRGYSKAVPVNIIEFLLHDNSAVETGSLPFFGRFSIETFRLDF
ncbi:MAG: alpha-mannosidase, partial [Bacteroidia bacterium]